jgi:hypothetical protein
MTLNNCQTELEKDKQVIRALCREVMGCKKAKHSARLQAATLLAGVQGLYGPGRTRVLARGSDSTNKPSKLNNPPTQANSIAQIVAGVYDEFREVAEDVQPTCNDKN